jgi:hypothetical protein
MIAVVQHSNQSTMKHLFSLIPKAQIQRSVFDRSHGYKTSFEENVIVPIFCDDVLPGDTFKLSLAGICRLATPIFPIMDNMWLDFHFFFVPYRLVWSDFESFMGAQEAGPSSSTLFTVPVVTMATVGTESIYDYMGLPQQATALYSNTNISALPFRAYNLIWNKWYRDENLENIATVSLGDGPDASANYALLTRNKQHDYFTSALPWTQKINDGSVVTIPLGVSATVKTSSSELLTGAGSGMTFRTSTGTQPVSANVGINASSQSVAETTFGTAATIIYPSNLYADLSTATAATINSLRQAFAMQKLFERDARGGTRYIEIIKAHFGVTSPDMRLQRPEYLGGGRMEINVAAVAQTSATNAQPTPSGNLSAFATGIASGIGFSHSFVEHGVVLGLMSTRADLTYSQGVNRMWQRHTRYDFFWPAFSHIGEQAITNNELFLSGSGTDNAAFGYQERYAEYRYKPSLLTGYMSPLAASSLDAWHLGQQFGALPTLSSSFVSVNIPISRVVAVGSGPHFIADFYFHLRCARPMPVYGVPGYIDHF